jgi:hypothetical protein
MVLTELWARGSAANSRKLNYVAIFFSDSDSARMSSET